MKKQTLTQPSPASGRGLRTAPQISFSGVREKVGMRAFFFS